MSRKELSACIAELEAWFARKPENYWETCTGEQLQQWEARARELDRLTALRDGE